MSTDRSGGVVAEEESNLVALDSLLGGEPVVESAPGEGATFTLWLPLYAPQAADA